MDTTYFWDTEYTLRIRPEPPAGFSHFCPGHLAWLLGLLLLCLALVPVYRRLRAGSRLLFRRILAGLLAADELFKYGVALYSGDFRPSFLPLHLCSINIFLILADAIRPNASLREILYAICLPGAFFALVFPGWNTLPLWNALCIHSFTAHILLFLYPVLLIAEGFCPSFRRLLRCLPWMLGAAFGVYWFNRAFGTNFMFLAWAGEGNPLAWFEKILGNPGYLLGIPIIAGGCWAGLYGLPKLWAALRVCGKPGSP